MIQYGILVADIRGILVPHVGGISNTAGMCTEWTSTILKRWLNQRYYFGFEAGSQELFYKSCSQNAERIRLSKFHRYFNNKRRYLTETESGWWTLKFLKEILLPIGVAEIVGFYNKAKRVGSFSSGREPWRVWSRGENRKRQNLVH